jgi:hypothetical protein
MRRTLWIFGTLVTGKGDSVGWRAEASFVNEEENPAEWFPGINKAPPPCVEFDDEITEPFIV